MATSETILPKAKSAKSAQDALNRLFDLCIEASDLNQEEKSLLDAIRGDLRQQDGETRSEYMARVFDFIQKDRDAHPKDLMSDSEFEDYIDHIKGRN